MSHLSGSATFILKPMAPFRLDFTVWALRRRGRNQIDRWDGTTYRRVVVMAGRPTELAVRQVGPRDAPRLVVNATPPLQTQSERRHLGAVIDRLLGLRIDLTDWYGIAATDMRLGSLARSYRGMKPPRFPTLFESIVNGFACQQLSLEVGLELLNRLALINNAKFDALPDESFAFPTAQDLTRLTPDRLRAIGFSRQKARAILELAAATANGTLKLELLARRDEATVRRHLLQLRGVGRWTAEYVLLRGVGSLNTFPGDDVGAQKRLARWLGRSRPLDYAGVGRVVKRWQPYAGMVYFHLLLDGLSRAGALDSKPADEQVDDSEPQAG